MQIGWPWRWRRRPTRARPRRSAPKNPWARFRLGLLALALVLSIGTIGYVILGLHPFDALYQTAITITTVGYGEIGIEDANDEGYRAFTLALVLLGASTALYTVSVLLETVVEGSLNDGLQRRRMSRAIDRMEGHIIVVGWGRVGRAIARYARRHNAEVVVVDQQPMDTGDLPHVVGDAHDDETLLGAGIARASVLIAALDTDSANLALTLTARSLKRDLFIVARTAKQTNERKFLQAGADRVVNPHDIGGSRMGALAMHPTVAEFLDEVLHDEANDVEIAEITIAADSPAIGSDLGNIDTGRRRAMVIAVRQSGGSYLVNPPDGTVVQQGDVLIALGSTDEVRLLRAAVTRRRLTVHFRGATAEG